MKRAALLFVALHLAALLSLGACSESVPDAPPDTTTVRVQLNWVPEPEFGGFYAAQQHFRAAGLNVVLISGGVSTPAGQLTATGQVEMGVISAEELLTLRDQGADLVALFATFQRAPFVLVVRADSPHTSLEALWKSKARVALEPGLPWIAELDRKFGPHGVELVPYDGQIAPFAAGKLDAMQGFIASEPVQLRLRGIAVRSFLLGESGYDPYAQVLVCTRKWLDAHRAAASAFLRALRAGWVDYNAQPAATNEVLHGLNTAMSREAMDVAAEIQLPLVAPEGVERESGSAIGRMEAARWRELAAQMLATGRLKKPVTDIDSLFVNLD